MSSDSHAIKRIHEMEASVKPITDLIRSRGNDFSEDTGFGLITEGCKLAELECWDVLGDSVERKRMLLSAVQIGNANQVRVLLAISESASISSLKGVFDVNSLDDFGLNGRTLMHEAAEAGHCDVIEALLEAGANVNILDDECCLAPLQLAVFHKQNAAADILRRAGASEHLHSVSEMSRPAVESAIRRAAMAGKEDAVRMIASVHGHVDHESLPLAAEQGHRGVVETLLECGAKVNQCDIQGFTALHHAASRGDSKMIRTLFAHGAAPAVHANGDGKLQSPLHVAANAKVVRILVSHGSIVDQRAWMGHTALHTAINAGRMDAAQALIEAGADEHIPNPTRLQQQKEDRGMEKEKKSWMGRLMCYQTFGPRRGSSGARSGGCRPLSERQQGKGLMTVIGYARE